MRRVPAVAGFILFMFSAFYLFPQVQRQNVQLNRADKGIIIDGILDEGGWKKYPPMDELIFIPPDRDEEARIQTSVKALYDDQYLYFGFTCADPEPDGIIAEVMEKDGEIRADDSVYVLVDTAFGREQYYYFSTNLHGTKVDGKIDQIGMSSNPEWDGVWEAVAAKNENGWSVEIAVELSCLEFGSTGHQTLMLAFSRVSPRHDISFWGGPLEPAFNFDQMGALRELEFEAERIPLQVAPFVVSSTQTGTDFKAQPGLDININWSAEGSGRILIGPEFKLVEPDNEDIILSPLEFRPPEKRPFFQRASMLFRQDLDLFYSRRLEDISGVADIHYQSGTKEFYALSSQVLRDRGAGVEPFNLSALRMNSRILPFFDLGVTAANKHISGNNMGTAGLDAALRFSSRFSLTAQFARSHGEFTSDNSALTVRAGFNWKDFRLILGFLRIGERFGDNANHVGYIPEDNIRGFQGTVSNLFSISKNKGVSLEFQLESNFYRNSEGETRSWLFAPSVSIHVKNWTGRIFHQRDFRPNDYFPAELITAGGYIDKNEFSRFREGIDDALYQNPYYVFDLYNPVTGTFQHIYHGSEDYYNFRTQFLSAFGKDGNNPFELAITFGRYFAQKFSLFEIYKRHELSPLMYIMYKFRHYLAQFDALPAYRNNSVHVIKLGYKISETLETDLFFQSNLALKKNNLWLRLSYLFRPPAGLVEIVIRRGEGIFGKMGTEDVYLFLNVKYGF